MDLFGDEKERKIDENPITGYSFKVIAPKYSNNKYILKKIFAFFIIIILILGICLISYFGYNFFKKRSIAKNEERKIKEEKLRKDREIQNEITNINIEAAKKKNETKINIRIPNFDKKQEEIINGKNKEIYLIFAGGPKEKTDEILTFLENEKIKANFFLLGNNIELYKETVKKIYDKKHFLGVTGQNEDYINIYESAESAAKSVKESKEKLEKTIGEDFKAYTSLMPGPLLVSRFDYLKDEAKKILNKEEIDVAKYNQYADIENESEDLNAVLDSKISSGSNVSLLIYEGGLENINVLKNIIKRFKDNGYAFKTYSDLTDNESYSNKLEEKENKVENEIKQENIITELN